MSSWAAISFLARSVTTIFQSFRRRFFHLRNWFSRLRRSSSSLKRKTGQGRLEVARFTTAKVPNSLLAHVVEVALPVHLPVVLPDELAEAGRRLADLDRVVQVAPLGVLVLDEAGGVEREVVQQPGGVVGAAHRLRAGKGADARVRGEVGVAVGVF